MSISLRFSAKISAMCLVKKDSIIGIHLLKALRAVRRAWHIITTFAKFCQAIMQFPDTFAQGLDFDNVGCTFSTLAPLWGSIKAPWDHFCSLLDALFVSKNKLGRQTCPKGRHPRFGVTHLGTFWRYLFVLFRVFDATSVYLTHTSLFFLNLLGAVSALGDGLICNPSTYMQSKHTFHFLHFFLKKGSLKSPTWAHVGTILH